MAVVAAVDLNEIVPIVVLEEVASLMSLFSILEVFLRGSDQNMLLYVL